MPPVARLFLRRADRMQHETGLQCGWTARSAGERAGQCGRACRAVRVDGAQCGLAACGVGERAGQCGRACRAVRVDGSLLVTCICTSSTQAVILRPGCLRNTSLTAKHVGVILLSQSKSVFRRCRKNEKTNKKSKKLLTKNIVLCYT